MPHSEPNPMIDPRYVAPAKRGWIHAANSSQPDVQAVLDEYEAIYPGQQLLVEPFHPNAPDTTVCWAIYRRKA